MRSTKHIYSSVLLTIFAVATAGLAAEPEKENLPAHGSMILRGENPKPPATYPESGGWMNSTWGAAFVYYPSVDNDKVQDPLGLELQYLRLTPGRAGYKVTVGFERWDSEDTDVVEDADLIPIGVSLLLSPLSPRGQFTFWLEAGLRYVFIDAGSPDGSYDNAITGLFGADVSIEVSPGVGIGLFAGYQTDISASENDAGEEYTLDGVMTQIAIRFEM